jgi:hypothetical protein
MLMATNLPLAQVKDTITRSIKPYHTSIGFRYGNETGISIKQFVSNNTSFEGIFSKDRNYKATRITVLYEVENEIGDNNQMFWFYGLGAHVSFYKSKITDNIKEAGYYDYRGKWHDTDNRMNYSTGGFDGMIGLEYQIKQVPIVIRIETKPNINIINSTIDYLNAAITISYYFK